MRSRLLLIIEDQDNELSGTMRDLLRQQKEMVDTLDGQITIHEVRLKHIAKENDACKRLMRMPGIGFITATLLLTVVGRMGDFKNGREFSAFLGLVPRQFSTGGKQRLLGITKRGDRRVRTSLIHGARAVLRSVKLGKSPLGQGKQGCWLQNIIEKRGPNKASVALANKMARAAWHMVTFGTDYCQAA